MPRRFSGAAGERVLSAMKSAARFIDGLFEVEGPDDEYYSQECLLAAVRKRVEVGPPRLFTEFLAET